MCALSFSVCMYVSVLSVHHTCIHTQSGREEEMGELKWGTEGEKSSFKIPSQEGPIQFYIDTLGSAASYGNSLAWDSIWFGLCASLLPPFKNVYGSRGPSAVGTRHTPVFRQCM